MKATGKVLAALLHVRQFHPKVIAVVYLPDTRWRFVDEDGEAPTFGDNIDVGILEDAQNEVDNTLGFPQAFTLPTTVRKVTVQITGQVILTVEEDEEVSDVFAELDIKHPDNTRVVDFTLTHGEITDSR